MMLAILFVLLSLQSDAFRGRYFQLRTNKAVFVRMSKDLNGPMPVTISSSAKNTANEWISVGSKILVATPVLSLLGASNSKADSLEGPVVVIGSGGKTGKLIIDYFIDKKIPVRPTYRGKIPSGFEQYSNVEAPAFVDVTNPETIGAAISGASSVIFAASASSKGGNAEKVDYIGVANVADACVKNKIPRLVVISSGAITRPDSLGFKITNLFGKIMEYKLKGENALREIYNNAKDDSLGYVIIRPGGLLDGAPVGAAKMELNQGDTISGEVSRADVAECTAAAALSKSIPLRVIFELYEAGKQGPLEGKFPAQSGFEQNGPKLGAKTYDDLFKGLKEGEVAI